MRFVLTDAEKRTFVTERMCYLGSVDGWIDVGLEGSIGWLARLMIPNLGTDELFEMLRRPISKRHRKQTPTQK